MRVGLPKHFYFRSTRSVEKVTRPPSFARKCLSTGAYNCGPQLGNGATQPRKSGRKMHWEARNFAGAVSLDSERIFKNGQNFPGTDFDKESKKYHIVGAILRISKVDFWGVRFH